MAAVPRVAPAEGNPEARAATAVVVAVTQVVGAMVAVGVVAVVREAAGLGELGSGAPAVLVAVPEDRALEP